MVENINTFNSVGTMKVTFSSLVIWVNMLWVNGLCALFNFFILSFKTIFIKSIHNDIILIKEKDNLFHEYVTTLPTQIKKLLAYKGCYVENSDKENKPKVNRTFKKHSSLRRVKIKRQKTNCVEFVGVDNDKEKDIDINDIEKENNKEKEDLNEINIYKRNNNQKKGKLKSTFYIKEKEVKKNKEVKINLSQNRKVDIISSKNLLKNRESLLIDEKWEVKNNIGNKINAQKNKKSFKLIKENK